MFNTDKLILIFCLFTLTLYLNGADDIGPEKRVHLQCARKI
jgi:hypothetical protein